MPLKYIDVSRTTHTNFDVKQEKRIDGYWNFGGSRDLSDPWTGFTQFILLEETSKRIYVVREEINEKTAVIQARSFYGQNSGTQWERMPSSRRRKSGHIKSSILTTHENCEEFISLTLRARNLRRPSRMLVRKRKQMWFLLCPGKLFRAIRIVGVVHPIKSKTKTCVYSGS